MTTSVSGQSPNRYYCRRHVRVVDSSFGCNSTTCLWHLTTQNRRDSPTPSHPAMPKNKNPQKKAQLQADTNTTFSGPPPGTAPTTDYKQIHEDEAEALSSIYDTDFEHIKVPSAAWQVNIKKLADNFKYLLF